MAARTYAQEAKTIMNKYKLRLGDKFDKGDPLAVAAMNAELEGLQAKQEQTRIAELPKGIQPLAKQFAKGGILPQYADGGFKFPKGSTTETFTPHAGGGEGMFSSADAIGATSDLLDDGTGDPFKSRVPWMGAAAGAIGGLLANRKIDLPTYDYEEYKPTQARANLVDYSRGREQTMRERDQAQGMITRNARGTGSQAGLMENILAGATGTQRAAGEAFNQSLEGEGNVNAQIRNQTSQFNAAQQAQAAQINARNKMFASQQERENVFVNDQRRQNRIGAVTGAVQGYTRDRLAANQYDQMVNMMAPDNYSVQADKDSLFRKLFQISPDQKISFKNTEDKSA